MRVIIAGVLMVGAGEVVGRTLSGPPGEPPSRASAISQEVLEVYCAPIVLRDARNSIARRRVRGTACRRDCGILRRFVIACRT